MGLCGMFFVLYPLNTIRVFWDDFEVAVLLRTFTSEIPGWIVVLIYLGFDLWGTVFDRHSGVGYLSHLIGGLMGASLAVVLLKSEWLYPDTGEQTLLQWLAGEGPVEPGEPSPSKKRKKSRTRAAGHPLEEQ
jgi:membrane associated rhomboid family serine protease